MLVLVLPPVSICSRCVKWFWGNHPFDKPKIVGKYILAESSGKEDDGDKGTLAPWELNPYRLVSWLEMQQFSAKAFFWCGAALKTIKSDCWLGAAVSVDGEVGFAMIRPLDDKARTKANKLLVSAEAEFEKIGLRISAETIRELRDELAKHTQHNFQWLFDRTEAIEALVNKEMKEKLFLYITPERQRFLPTMGKPHLFGDKVSAAFPSANYEISEAGWCLALARGSGAVFHLMRVLEIGLGAFGAIFGISLAHTNWEPAIREIESKVREMHKDPTWKALPDCKDKQETYAQAASHFGILKDAWRNYTMHIRGMYTEEQAEEIFMSVKGFMNKLEVLGLKETP